MAKLIIPTPLRKFTGDQSTFEGRGATVAALIDELVERHQGVREHLLDADGRLRSFVRVYVGEDDIQALQGTETPVGEGTTVSIIPAIAGGTEHSTP